MIATFVVLAAGLTAAAAIAVAIPLLRRRATSAPARWAALAATAVLVVGSGLLYASWGNWHWSAAPAGDSPQNMVARLARELERDPQNLDGWLMLGRSYVVLQEYPLALRAYERAERLSGGKSVEALTGEAEALALIDESELDGRAARLIDRALALDPNSGKALFFAAAIAERRGDLPLARQHFTKLLALNLPENVRPILEQQITAIDQKLAVTSADAATPQKPSAGTADAVSPVVRVNVTLAPSLGAVASSGAPLFVFVRNPGEAGPPLAVKRLDSHFPQNVALSPADSMVPGRAFAAGQSVQVVARIARSGSPVGASGDPYGEVTYRVGSDGLVSLVIDHLTP